MLKHKLYKILACSIAIIRVRRGLGHARELIGELSATGELVTPKWANGGYKETAMILVAPHLIIGTIVDVYDRA